MNYRLGLSCLSVGTWPKNGSTVLTTAHKDWISLLKKNRTIETNRFVLKDAAGKPIVFSKPHIQGPRNWYRLFPPMPIER